MNRPRELSERTLAGYELQWSRFAEWSQARGMMPMPATTEIVERYINEMSDWGARVSSVKVAVAAIARRHIDEGLDNPCSDQRVQRTLAEMAEREVPITGRSRPLDLNCYIAIRDTALERRRRRDGRLESAGGALDRGYRDIAMIGLMRDAMLRSSEASILRWKDIEQLEYGSGLVRVGDGAPRTVSRDTLEMLDQIRRDAPDDRSIFGASANWIGRLIGAAAEHAGLGKGFGGDSPRLGMLADLETIGVLLLSERLNRPGPPPY